MKKYQVVFSIEGVEKHDIMEVIEIVASDEVAAQTGAYKTFIHPKYKGKGGRYLVIHVEELENA